MRLRRLAAAFCAICFVVSLFILYVITDLSFKLPSIKPGGQELDDVSWLPVKWSAFNNKLRHIESELNQHNALVDEIKSVVNKFVQYSQNEKPIKLNYLQENSNPKLSLFEQKIKYNESACAMEKNKVPQPDIQMLSMYEEMDFQDVNGGVWKQGWDIKYNENDWNQRKRLKVIIVPHSHNDPGWIKTFEDYYRTQTRAIFNNMVEKLVEQPGRKFIWAETSYLALWWSNDADGKQKAIFQNLLQSGQIEIVTGGWVMNDEANSHWLSIQQQLATGHQWLIENLDYVPKNSWAIDPFGYSSSQPYLLKLAGLENSVIQRVHYIVKKELARNKQLEFKWRQLWDGTGKTEMFTHMMPFYSYDIPHTCGPDPSICCQFDFKRLPGNGVSCAWGKPARPITEKNIAERSFAILDQWRKKAQLYRSNVLMVPLGDDFRYDSAIEWDNQYKNYEKLIDYINAKTTYNAEVQFGTLEDYFSAVHSEMNLSEFPVLSGDFFTYSDRNDHYWSGYYTSRPFYKNMDRVLLAYVRAAEIMSSQAIATRAATTLASVQLRDKVEEARRSLALFQHHDGVTGTSRNAVREDYANKLHAAIKYSQAAIQQAAYLLLNKPQVTDKIEVDDIWHSHNELPGRITIALDEIEPTKKIVLYNSLTYKRQEIVSVIVSTPYVEVHNPDGDTIPCQVSPVLSGANTLIFASNKYQVSFLATVDALSLVVYTVAMKDAQTAHGETKYSKIRIFNAEVWNVDMPKVFEVNKTTIQERSVIIKGEDGTRLLLNENGFLKAIASQDRSIYPIEMEFVSFRSETGADRTSGAYLFMPNGAPEVMAMSKGNEIVVIEGSMSTTVYTVVKDTNNVCELFVVITVRNNPSLPQMEVEIANTILFNEKKSDYEVALKLNTNVNNDNVFYTDLNGMQMIRRMHLDKLPTQANFYPLSAAAYIEDEVRRLTVLTSTPLGVAARAHGQIEIMQDRRLSRDDNRGLAQGVMDNIRTKHNFKLIFEKVKSACDRSEQQNPMGLLSLGAHLAQQAMLFPLVVMQYTTTDSKAHVGLRGPRPLGAALLLASYRTHLTGKIKDGTKVSGYGMTFQRVYFDTCFENENVTKFYPPGDGTINILDLMNFDKDIPVYDSSLTYLHVANQIPNGELTVCPMEIRSVFIRA